MKMTASWAALGQSRVCSSRKCALASVSLEVRGPQIPCCVGVTAQSCTTYPHHYLCIHGFLLLLVWG